MTKYERKCRKESMFAECNKLGIGISVNTNIRQLKAMLDPYYEPPLLSIPKEA